MLLRYFTVALAAALAAGCTRGTVAVPPTAPTPVLTSLTITPQGGGTMMVGSTAPIATSGALPSTGTALGAFAQFSHGPGRYVEATWTSSDAAIISVEAGLLVARGRGTVTLTATYEGKSDTETFTADGGVAGRWAGSYVVEQCGGTSGSVEEVLCNPAGNSRPVGIAAVGTTLPLSLDISENGADLTATVSFGAIRGTLAGRNRGGGFLYLQGVIEGAGGAINIIHWDTRVSGDGMEGFIGYQARLPGLPGFGTVAAKLAGVTRR